MDDEFGDDVDYAAAFEAVEKQAASSGNATASASSSSKVVTPSKPGVKQPVPQKLARPSLSAIVVNPRQKGNPILNAIRAVPWEYGDIIPDYLLGNTTCALFLSLKYHRLHPEYIYSRIRALGHTYKLRILLVMVDVDTHTDPLKELAKTSLINNLTLILSWSSPEAGRYLETFKSYEHTPPTLIKQHAGTSYKDHLIEFATTPRSINKTDAVSLVTNFGSLKRAINAQPEDIAMIGGFGERKVKIWTDAMREPFRLRKAAKKKKEVEPLPGKGVDDGYDGVRGNDALVAARLGVGPPIPIGRGPVGQAGGMPPDRTPGTGAEPPVDLEMYDPDEDEEALLAAMEAEEAAMSATGLNDKGKRIAVEAHGVDTESQDNGVMAALAKLREKG
jgi:DNA excision repair protein ERCC-1